MESAVVPMQTLDFLDFWPILFIMTSSCGTTMESVVFQLSSAVWLANNNHNNNNNNNNNNRFWEGSFSVASCRVLALRSSPIAHHPSPIAHRPSSIAHRSLIVHRSPHVVHRSFTGRRRKGGGHRKHHSPRGSVGRSCTGSCCPCALLVVPRHVRSGSTAVAKFVPVSFGTSDTFSIVAQPPLALRICALACTYHDRTWGARRGTPNGLSASSARNGSLRTSSCERTSPGGSTRSGWWR